MKVNIRSILIRFQVKSEIESTAVVSVHSFSTKKRAKTESGKKLNRFLKFHPCNLFTSVAEIGARFTHCSFLCLLLQLKNYINLIEYLILIIITKNDDGLTENKNREKHPPTEWKNRF